MTEFDNTNTGALFANADRKTDKHPNARGTLNVDGVEFWISAWTRTSKKGERYQSLAVQRKDGKAADKPAAKSESESFNDEIPF